VNCVTPHQVTAVWGIDAPGSRSLAEQGHDMLSAKRIIGGENEDRDRVGREYCSASARHGGGAAGVELSLGERRPALINLITLAIMVLVLFAIWRR